MDFWAELPVKLQCILEKAGLESPREIICLSDSIFTKHGATPEDIAHLRNIAAKCIIPGFVTVNDVIRNQSSKWCNISFGCQALDKCTGGGIPTRGITEIYGESGAGKTQLLLQLSLTVQLPEKYGGLGKSAVFISTEGRFPSKRLLQIAQHFNKTFADINVNFSQNVFVEHILESEDLLRCVSARLPNFMESHNVGLIVIDSVAAIYRIESNFVARANEMRNLVNQLLMLSDKHHCAVICVNQVASAGSNTQVPCLGLAWASLVRTRLRISKTKNNAVCNTSRQLYSVRKLEVVYSPAVGNNTCEFLITPEGVVDLP